MLAELILALSVPLWGSTDKLSPIQTASIELYCPASRRQLPIKAAWPVGEGKAPVIVFSHGYLGSKDSYEPMASYWAEHGYIVLRMTHSDSLQYKTTREARESVLNKSVTEFSNALDRPKEVSFVIDSFGKIEREIPALKGRLDPARIGIGGHSFGAHTAMIGAGLTTKAGAAMPEKRAKAFLLLSPQGVGGALDESSWRKISSPMMVVSGTKDGSSFGRAVTPEHRRDPYTYSPPGDKYLLWMDGADHGLGGVAGSSPFRLRAFNRAQNPDQLRTVQSVSLAFFDAYVKSDKRALEWLRAKDLAKSLPTKSEFLSK